MERPPIGSIRQRIPALDGLRGIAILGVIIRHFWPGSSLPADTIWSWADLGSFGVDLFFVLSGFLITGILLDSRRSPTYFRTFYSRRVFRLFPLYYAYLLFLAFLLPVIHQLARTTMPDYTGNWWWYITYFCNWKANHAAPDPYLGHFWSLAVEEQFYMIWPLIIFVTPVRHLAKVCAALVLFSFGLRCLWSLQGVETNTIYRLTITRFDPLALGALAALALRSERWRPAAIRLAPRIGLILFGTFIVVAAFAGGPNWERPAIQTFGSLFADAGFGGMVIFAATATNGSSYRALCSRRLVEFGKYSYCIYVIHVVIGFHLAWVAGFLTKKAPGGAVAFEILAGLCAVLLSFVIARWSWNYFEAPLISKGRAWFEGRPA